MEENLWNDIDSKSVYGTDEKIYQEHIMEQYKLYVEMADRISARRNLANVFFLTLHTTLLGAVGFAFEKIQLVDPKWLVSFPVLILIVLCVVWGWLIKSYRNVSSAKYRVIGEMEKRLPTSPYASAEWKALGEGKDYKKYLPLTGIEIYVPIIFGLIYLMLGVYVLFLI